MFPSYRPEEKQSESQRGNEFDEPCEIILIHVGSEQAATTQGERPVQFPVGREVLDNPKERNGKPKDHEEPDKALHLVRRAERLNRQKEDQNVGAPLELTQENPFQRGNTDRALGRVRLQQRQ